MSRLDLSFHSRLFLAPRGFATSTACVALALASCQAPPRIDPGAEASIARAVGFAEPIAFRVIGPDGGPLDEPLDDWLVLGASFDDARGDSSGNSFSERHAARADALREPSDAALVLTQAAAVRAALTRDPGLQVALARLRAASADADAARLWPNPVLDVALRVGSGAPQIEASLAHELVRALQRGRRATIADHALREAAADTVTTALDLVADVRRHYVAAQAAAALLPLLEQRLALVERLVRTADARLEVGEGTRADRVTLAAQRVEVEVSIAQTREAERSERLQLARRIGAPSSRADWSLESWPPPAEQDAPELAWIATALDTRPEIQALAWRAAALDEQAELAGASRWQDARAGIDAELDGGASIGPSVSLPLPLFDTGDARRARADAERLAARHELALARRRVVEDVRVAHAALLASRASLARVRGELLPLQRERRQLAEDAYRAGQTDVTPLFLAEQDLRIAETRAIESEAAVALAHVRLQRAVGGRGASAATEAPKPSEPRTAGAIDAQRAASSTDAVNEHESSDAAVSSSTKAVQ